MGRFFGFFEEKFLPVAGRFGSQRHLVAIRDGFAGILPLIIIGSLAVLINNLPIQPFQDFMEHVFSEHWKNLGGYIWNGTFAIISLLVCFSVSYNLARHYKVDALAAGLVSVAALIILTPLVADGQGISLNWMSASGLFVSLIVGLLATEIFRKLSQMNLVIKMPEGVPEAVSRSFASMIPAMIVLAIFGILQILFIDVIGTSVQDIIYKSIQAPFQHMAASLPGILAIEFTKSFLWFFGLHGSNILEPVIESVYLPSMQENIQLFNQGVSAYQVPHIITKPFIDVFVAMGGIGTGLSLIIAIFIVGRSRQVRSIGKLGGPAALFNINEPIIFGIPVVLNPILFVPFLLVPLVNVTIAYCATSLGLVPRTVVMVPWTTPPIIGGYLATGGSLAGSILQLVNLAVGTFIYLPFLRMLDKQMLKNAPVEKMSSLKTIDQKDTTL
ncbi:PTS cellobiose transporter subunit IIC [Caenibacillus caldisaponilyticus]|uniref:PTS cellobiose transporter subunit IIC n=1 Tax=Caenibacillus caldisaponilyticus TaxID=1674942 RepID=UPI00098846E6|nr:PTS cellobiose transporter subunit IIC [Caenibacillus caldisaponilyticus]